MTSTSWNDVMETRPLYSTSHCLELARLCFRSMFRAEDEVKRIVWDTLTHILPKVLQGVQFNSTKGNRRNTYIFRQLIALIRSLYFSLKIRQWQCEKLKIRYTFNICWWRRSRNTVWVLVMYCKFTMVL